MAAYNQDRREPNINPPMDYPGDQSESSPSSPNDNPRPPPPRRSRASSQSQGRRSRRPSESDPASATPAKERILSFGSRDREAKKMTTVLYMLSDELDAERARAVSAEADNAELRVQMRALIAERDRARTEVVQVRRALEEWQRRCGEAQQEIFRGQAILDRVEAQRLDAEADAARSRSTARQFKEELLVIRAREEGFEIGFKRGFARARNEAAGGNRYGQELVREDSDESDPSIETAFTTELPPPPPPPIERPRRSQSARPSTSSRHSHRTHDTALHAPTLPVPTLTTPLPVPSPSHAPPSRAASRTPVPIPVPAPLHAPEEIHPIPSRWHSRSPSCKSAADIPPDNWIPVSHGGGAMDIPPPHEMAPPPPSPSPRPIPAPPIPPPEEGMLFQPVRARDYAYPDGAQRQGQGRRSRASSMASRGSTHISELDIVSPPRGDPRNYPNDPRNNYPNDPRNSNYTNDPRGTTPRPPSQQQRRQTEIIAEQWRNANPDVHRGGAARANPDVGAAAARRHDLSSPRVGGPRRPREVVMPTPLAGAPSPSPSQPLAGASRQGNPPAGGPRKVQPHPQAQSQEDTRRSPLDFIRKRFVNRSFSSPGVPNISIEPPSKSPSNDSSTSGGAPQPNLLSPDLSMQPLPRDDAQNRPAPPPRMPSPHDGPMPAGFVPLGGPPVISHSPDYFSYEPRNDPLRPKRTPQYPSPPGLVESPPRPSSSAGVRAASPSSARTQSRPTRRRVFSQGAENRPFSGQN